MSGERSPIDDFRCINGAHSTTGSNDLRGHSSDGG